MRYIFGVFVCRAEENDTIFLSLEVSHGGLLIQPFWTGDVDARLSDEDMAAVADHLGIQKQTGGVIKIDNSRIPGA